MSGYISLHCGVIFSSAKKAHLPATHLCPFPNIASGLAAEMVIPSQVGLD